MEVCSFKGVGFYLIAIQTTISPEYRHIIYANFPVDLPEFLQLKVLLIRVTWHNGTQIFAQHLHELHFLFFLFYLIPIYKLNGLIRAGERSVVGDLRKLA